MRTLSVPTSPFKEGADTTVIRKSIRRIHLKLTAIAGRELREVATTEVVVVSESALDARLSLSLGLIKGKVGGEDKRDTLAPAL